MTTSNEKAIKSSFWYTFANFLIMGVGVITTPIFTRIMTKEAYGIVNNYNSWLSIITMFANLNLTSSFGCARYDFEDDFDSYIFSMLALSTLSVGFFFVLSMVFSDSVTQLLTLDNKYVQCMLIYLIFSTALNMYQLRERYYYGYKKSVFLSLLVSLSTSFLAVLLVVKLDDKAWGKVLGSALPTIIIGFLLCIILMWRGKKIKLKYWKYALPICIPYIPHLLSMSLLNSMDRTMITSICGAEDTALYSLAYTVGSMVTLLINSLNTAFGPWFSEKMAHKEYKEINGFTKKYIILMMIPTIGVMLLAPEILWILGGDQYLESIYVLTPIAMGCFAQFIYIFFVDVEQFTKHTVGMAFASVTAALVNYVLNAIFIPKIGYLAAAYTTLVGYLVLMTIHMVLVKKIGYSEVYDYGYVIKSVIVMICIMIGITLTYAHTAVRYGVIVVFAGVIIVYALKHKEEVEYFIRIFIKKKK